MGDVSCAVRSSLGHTHNIEESTLPVLPTDVHVSLINYVFPVNLIECLIHFLKVPKRVTPYFPFGGVWSFVSRWYFIGDENSHMVRC